MLVILFSFLMEVWCGWHQVTQTTSEGRGLQVPTGALVSESHLSSLPRPTGCRLGGDSPRLWPALRARAMPVLNRSQCRHLQVLSSARTLTSAPHPHFSPARDGQAPTEDAWLSALRFLVKLAWAHVCQPSSLCKLTSYKYYVYTEGIVALLSKLG